MAASAKKKKSDIPLDVSLGYAIAHGGAGINALLFNYFTAGIGYNPVSSTYPDAEPWWTIDAEIPLLVDDTAKKDALVFTVENEMLFTQCLSGAMNCLQDDRAAYDLSTVREIAKHTG